MDNSQIEKNLDKLELVKERQTKNIDILLTQADKLKILEAKAEKLQEEANIFSKTTHPLKMKNTWRKKRDTLGVLGMVFFAVFLTCIIGVLGLVFFAVFLTCIIGSPAVILLSIVLGAGVIFGMFYANKQEKEKKDPILAPSVYAPSVYAPSIEPTFNNFTSKNKESKNKESKNKITCSENKISYAPKK